MAQTVPSILASETAEVKLLGMRVHHHPWQLSCNFMPLCVKRLLLVAPLSGVVLLLQDTFGSSFPPDTRSTLSWFFSVITITTHSPAPSDSLSYSGICNSSPTPLQSSCTSEVIRDVFVLLVPITEYDIL